MLSFILLQRFSHSTGPISVEDARILTVLTVITLITGLILWKYGNVVRKFREWYRKKTRISFEDLSPQKKLEVLKNAYCLRRGQLEALISPIDAMNKGEYVIRGKCPRCGDVVEIQK